jgi:GNAT superfamily N-acetyltransferase
MCPVVSTARRLQVTGRTIGTMSHVGAADDLLLFRAVVEPARGAAASRMLDDATGGRGWRCRGEADLWELHDAVSAPDEEPVAVAATCPSGDGRRVRLVGLVVAPSLRGRGLGRRLLEDLSDALRARGALAVVAAVPSDHATAIVVVQRAGFRASHVERASPGSDGRDLLWFDAEL